MSYPSSGSRRVVVERALLVVHGRRGSRRENLRRGRSWRSGLGVVGLRASRSEDLDVGEKRRTRQERRHTKARCRERGSGMASGKTENVGNGHRGSTRGQSQRHREQGPSGNRRTAPGTGSGTGERLHGVVHRRQAQLGQEATTATEADTRQQEEARGRAGRSKGRQRRTYQGRGEQGEAREEKVEVERGGRKAGGEREQAGPERGKDGGWCGWRCARGEEEGGAHGRSSGELPGRGRWRRGKDGCGMGNRRRRKR